VATCICGSSLPAVSARLIVRHDTPAAANSVMLILSMTPRSPNLVPRRHDGSLGT